MTEHRFIPGKEWGSKARKAEDAPGRKAQERQAAIEDQVRCGYCPPGRCVEFNVDVPLCEEP